MKQIGQGAEAKLFLDDEKVVKVRPKKGYRLEQLDTQLRKARTRREAKILEKLEAAAIKAPKLVGVCDKDMKVEMSFINGKKLRDAMTVDFAKEMGKVVGHFHANHIVHGDLTTSNLLVQEEELHVIDFGLSFFSHKVEDKAVDLHVLDRALESQHHEVYDELIKAVFEGYVEVYPESEQVLKRFEEVKMRGRNKKQ